MTARKGTPDLMSQVLSGKPTTGSVPAVTEMGKKTRFNFWIPATWKKALETHFAAQGLDLSSGIRQVLARYMDEERLK